MVFVQHHSTCYWIAPVVNVAVKDGVCHDSSYTARKIVMLPTSYVVRLKCEDDYDCSRFIDVSILAQMLLAHYRRQKCTVQ